MERFLCRSIAAPMLRYRVHERTSADLDSWKVVATGAANLPTCHQRWGRTCILSARLLPRGVRPRPAAGTRRRSVAIGDAGAIPVSALPRARHEDVFEAAEAFSIQQSNYLFGHDLEKLLSELRKVVGSYELSSGAKLDEVALTILEIHRADQRATAFRYAIRLDGEPQFEEHGVVDVPLLMERMASAADFFEHLLNDMVEEERRMDEAIRTAVTRDPS
jgi:hypothetical protein